jgi:hypothetical protein
MSPPICTALLRVGVLWGTALLASCGNGSTPAVPASGEPRLLVAFPVRDRISSEYAWRVLTHHGIKVDMTASVVTSLVVDEVREAEAVALLKAIPAIRPFLSPNDPGVPEPVWDADVAVDVEIREALMANDTSSTVGALLREAVLEAPAAILEKWPVVDRVRWRCREFVHRDLTPAVAIEGVVVFARKAGGAPGRSREAYVSVMPPE